MTVGLEVRNDFNTIVIDSNYSNLLLGQQGSVSVNLVDTYGSGITLYSGSITTAVKNPQLFFKNTNGAYVAVYNATYDVNSTVFSIYTNAGGSFNYLIFGTDIPLSSNNYGLQVFKEDGTLAFDSGSKILKYETVIQMSGSSGQDSISYPLPVSSTQRAACISFSRTSAIVIGVTPFPRIGMFIDSIRVNSNSIDAMRMIYRIAPGQPDTNYPAIIATPAQLIVADVTGY